MSSPAPFPVEFVVEKTNETIQTTAYVGEKINQTAYRAGITIQQTCGGTPSCTDCRVRVLEGLEDGFEKPLNEEIKLMGNVFHITKERLACQAVVKGPSKVFVPTPTVRTKRR